MSIQNTEKLTQSRCDLGNAGLQAFNQVVSDGEINDLANYYRLGYVTVQRWFAGVGRHADLPYRRCVPRFTWEEIPAGDTSPGYRVYDMKDPQNPSGQGDPTPRYVKQGDGSGGQVFTGGSDLSNLRQRCFLAFCLGVDGGLERIPIYTGETKYLYEPKGSLKECVYRINQIYTGAFSKFLYKAWVSFEIQYDFAASEGWLLVIAYNAMEPTDGSDDEEENVQDDTDSDEENEG